MRVGSAAAGASKPGMTKTELAEVKKAAEGAPPSGSSTPVPSAAAAGGSAPPGALDTTAAGQGLVADAQQMGQAPGAAAAASTAAAAAAGGGGPAPLKPMTLQHQLLSAADVSGQAAAPFVAGGVPPRNKAVQREGGEDPLRELMLADLVAALERHPLYCRSPELYALHTLAALQADSMK